jgi:hypothetical protein
MGVLKLLSNEERYVGAPNEQTIPFVVLEL